MLKEKRFYEFKNFRLDLEEKVLSRDGERLPLTPKAFQLLKFLIERRGRVIEKDVLMAEIWADSFVEQGNIAFTIRRLRMALGDDAHNPTFIETVPRRGYRFVAETTVVSAAENDVSSNEKTGQTAAGEGGEKAPVGKYRFLLNYFTVFSLIVSLTLLLGFTVWFLPFGERIGGFESAPVLSARRKSEPLSTSGNVFLTRISPDGKYVVYVKRNQNKQSVWLRELATATDVQLLPYSEDEYGGLMFSGGSDFIYFVKKTLGGMQEQSAIYRLSIFGGIPTKLIPETQGWFSLSPKDDSIAFVRFAGSEHNQSVLAITDSDGRNERKLAVRNIPYNFRANRWSPDGLSIAVAVGQSDNGSNEFNLTEISAETGEEKSITSFGFFYIQDLEWLPGGGGLLFTARENSVPRNQIWHVSRADGATTKMTDDAVNYGNISLNKDATSMMATQIVSDFYISVAEFGDPAINFQTTSAAAVTYFTPNGKILYSSLANGQQDIWMMNADGSGQRQLTNNSFDDFHAMASPDEKFIFFTSNRSGNNQIWRMNSDGADQIQVTKKAGGYPLYVSPDNKTLIYLSSIGRNLWKFSAEDGSEKSIFDKSVLKPGISADGKTVAYFYRDTRSAGKIFKLSVASLETGEIIKTFTLSDAKERPIQINWSADGKSLYYASMINSNKFLWKRTFDAAEPPQKIRDLGSDDVLDFSSSPDQTKFTFVSGRWKHDAILIKGFK